jgi:ACS family allantoate permease-like MFS transporter
MKEPLLILLGIIVLCIVFAKNLAGLMVLRALQGVCECTISPTFLLLTGLWYTSREHTMRSIIWGTANAGMQIICSLISYGIGFQAQKHPGGLAPWRGISIFLGCLTIMCSILVFFILGTPRKVRWLSEDEKRMAVARVVANQTGSDRQKRGHWKWGRYVSTIPLGKVTSTDRSQITRSSPLLKILRLTFSSWLLSQTPCQTGGSRNLEILYTSPLDSPLLRL